MTCEEGSMEELIISVNPKAGKVEWNKEELTAMIDAVTAQYDGLVYTEAQVPEAKKDRANLNKALGVVEDERKRVKAEIMKPYDEFDKELKGLTGKIKDVIAQIDEQVKGYENQKKTEKKEALYAYYEANIGSVRDLVPFEPAVFDPKMLNASVSLEQAKKQISERIERIYNDLRALEGMETEFKDALKAYYYKTFDLGATLQEQARLQAVKRMEEERLAQESQRKHAAVESLAEKLDVPAPEMPKVEAPEEEEEYEMQFTVTATMKQLKDLKAYMDAAGIKYK
mgnify:CR=1 FL=1